MYVCVWLKTTEFSFLMISCFFSNFLACFFVSKTPKSGIKNNEYTKPSVSRINNQIQMK